MWCQCNQMIACNNHVTQLHWASCTTNLIDCSTVPTCAAWGLSTSHDVHKGWFWSLAQHMHHINVLSHCDKETPIMVSNIGSGKGSAPNHNYLNHELNHYRVQWLSLRKMHLKMLSASWRPFCSGINVLKHMPWSSVENGWIRHRHLQSPDVDCIDGWMQDYSNSIANALQLLQFCAKPSVLTVYWIHSRGKQWRPLSVMEYQ